MKSSRFLLCFLYWFFNQLQALVGEMTTRVAVKDCFYDGRLGHYSFPVNIGGISEIVSCLEECSCNGTAIGWQSKFNCEWCCCEIRLPFKEVVPSRISFFKIYQQGRFVSQFPISNPNLMKLILVSLYRTTKRHQR